MALYDFHVGSTVQHDAHENDDAVSYLSRHYPGTVSQRLWGQWENETERTAMFTVDLPTDAVAERVAGILAALTGNDCVMVVRLTRDSDSPAGGFGDRGRFRVSPRTVSEGNRILFSDPATRGFTDGPYGVAFQPDRQGSHVAFLAWRNGTISPVQ